MKIARLRHVHPHAPPLSPPMTEDEGRWWKMARRPIGLRVVLQFSGPFFLVAVAAQILKGERLSPWLVTADLLLASLMGFAMWAAAEKGQRVQEIRWKRIREDLVVEGEGSVSGGAGG